MPAPDFKSYARKVIAAARKADARATEAQRVAQNARTGLVHLHGLSIAIESPVGSIRRGVTKGGRKWECVVRAHYGRVRRTTNAEGEQVDVYIGPHPESQLAFVVDKLDDEGNHEEVHLLLGFKNTTEAKKCYLSHYPDGWADKHVGEIRGLFVKDLKRFLASNQVVTAELEKKSSMFCRRCSVFYHGHDECPECGPEEEKKAVVTDLVALRSVLRGG